MAMAKVVVGYNVGFRAIPGALNGVHFIGSGSPAGLIEELRNVICGMYKLDDIGNAARRLMREEYSWEQIFDRFLFF